MFLPLANNLLFPNTITPTGMYVEGDYEENEEYEKNTFDQDDILHQLDSLIALIVEVEKHTHKTNSFLFLLILHNVHFLT
ncbi:hypothetical protein V5E38_07795 [Rossellomorea sp. GAMAL-10_SWC]